MAHASCNTCGCTHSECECPGDVVQRIEKLDTKLRNLGRVIEDLQAINRHQQRPQRKTQKRRKVS